LFRLADEQERSKEAFVEHYRNKYKGENHLPIWMATELLTFGSLSQLYCDLLSPEQKRQISTQLDVADNVLSSWLQSLAYVRNLCAHHSRTWNRKLSISPKIPKRWRAGNVEQNKVYAVLLILEYILAKTSPNSTWRQRVTELITENQNIATRQMGFPNDWNNRRPFGAAV
jgi:abortive infection bacteriophage resistance protein